MFSSIPRYYTPPATPHPTPPASTASSVIVRRRTTSAPAEPTFGSGPHAARHYLYVEGKNGTNSLSLMNAKPRPALRISRLADTPTPTNSIRCLSVSTLDSAESLLNIGHQSIFFEQKSDGTLIASRTRSNTGTIKEENETSDDSDKNSDNNQGPATGRASFSSIADPSNGAIVRDPMEEKLRKIFAPFTTSQNKKEIDILVADRCDALLKNNIGVEELERRLKIADNVDNMTAIFFGGLSALGFVLGGQAFAYFASTLKKELPVNVMPYVPGGITGAADRILGSILKDTHVGYYTKDNPAMLEGVMQEKLGEFQRPLVKELTFQAGALSAPYTTRNIVCAGAAPLAEHFGMPGAVGLMNDTLALLAGPGVQLLRNDDDRKDLLMHPAYLLGRQNWKSQLHDLRHSPFAHQRIMRLINRTCIGSKKIPNMLFNACKRLITIDSATEISLLMVGFACHEWLKDEVADEFENTSPEVSAFLKSSVGTLFLSTLYCSLSFAMTGAGRLTQMLKSHQHSADNA